MHYLTKRAVERLLPSALVELRRSGDPVAPEALAELAVAKLTPSELESAAVAAVSQYIDILLAHLPIAVETLPVTTVVDLVNAAALEGAAND